MASHPMSCPVTPSSGYQDPKETQKRVLEKRPRKETQRRDLKKRSRKETQEKTLEKRRNDGAERHHTIVFHDTVIKCARFKKYFLADIGLFWQTQVSFETCIPNDGVVAHDIGCHAILYHFYYTVIKCARFKKYLYLPRTDLSICVKRDLQKSSKNGTEWRDTRCRVLRHRQQVYTFQKRPVFAKRDLYLPRTDLSICVK